MTRHYETLIKRVMPDGKILYIDERREDDKPVAIEARVKSGEDDDDEEPITLWESYGEDTPADVVSAYTAWCKERERTEEEVRQEINEISTGVISLSSSMRGHLWSIWRNA